VAEIIYLGFLNGYSPSWADKLARRVAETLPFPLQRLDVNIDLDAYYAPDRRQYHATLILAHLLRHLPDDDSKILSITSIDLYIPVLTFVFGQSQLDGPGAVVSTFRLHNEYYGLPADDVLLFERAVKEVVHELGHAFGLVHCPDHRCVMNSSTYVEHVDLKEARFCSDCQKLLNNRDRF
jgi:archaemetzincin